MSELSLPEDHPATVESLTAELEGSEFMTHDDNDDHFICDFCSKGVSFASKPRVGYYLADGLLRQTETARRIREERRLTSLATYCPECTTKMLLFPCQGFTEVRALFDLDTDRIMKNVEITDVSGRDDGIPWDPRELSERITGVPFETNRIAAGEHLWGPENLVTFFLSIAEGVDIRELVKWDGSLDPKLLGRARREYKEFQEKMHSQGHGRRAFSKHVRGEDS